MNELIEHLAEKATKEMDQEAFSEDMNIPAEWYHKFAELIVKECVGIVSKRKNQAIDDGWNVDEAMSMADLDFEEHFGVEE